MPGPIESEIMYHSLNYGPVTYGDAMRVEIAFGRNPYRKEEVGSLPKPIKSGLLRLRVINWANAPVNRLLYATSQLSRSLHTIKRQTSH